MDGWEAAEVVAKSREEGKTRRRFPYKDQKRERRTLYSYLEEEATSSRFLDASGPDGDAELFVDHEAEDAHLGSAAVVEFDGALAELDLRAELVPAEVEGAVAYGARVDASEGKSTYGSRRGTRPGRRRWRSPS